MFVAEYVTCKDNDVSLYDPRGCHVTVNTTLHVRFHFCCVLRNIWTYFSGKVHA